MPRIAGTETEARLPGDDDFAQAQSHGGDAVFRAHGRKRVVVVGPRDAGHVGIEALASRRYGPPARYCFAARLKVDAYTRLMAVWSCRSRTSALAWSLPSMNVS